MASIDGRYRFAGVVSSRSGTYRAETRGLDGYLAPKRDVEVTRGELHRTGRGVVYTKTPFAYLFDRIR